MSSSAKITFSRPGVRPPVYLVTSLSSPLWQVIEMEHSGNTDGSDDPVFYKEFENVAEGQYQYKIRLGEYDWILDDTAETGKRT